ncbi:cell wall assembly and cell proliferation coordinating protein [Pseudovirgaria hyperparasitica]|uniref:Cell wall assembly and cell proliferation coordinating protein n=1 Tax=Pseudovirgaria hyperparasitica TaxID=470096 RepID=A0A6A6W490_9PEZI|nr:cell wall assembly and cell proliferation coordinating protein [Pseudovirgaria hyperparasitica]KAF2755861.1 cell wall assembly and cell proliferation coordinating protein [Pseudovirgaria hyperparasitica]
MAQNLFTQSLRSFWHTMTSYDRHASFDSPYRTGRHVPLPQSRHAPLTSVATTAFESRQDLSYGQDDPQTSNGFMNSPSEVAAPNSPYVPGQRSTLSRQNTGTLPGKDDESRLAAGEIPMQSFSDGLPPPPPVSHSWKRIDRWAEDHYEELFEQLCEGCTKPDVDELEHELDCTLPLDVQDSLRIHDGQERGGRPTGIVFGLMLLDCEEIVEEWSNWRKVRDDHLAQRSDFRAPQPPSKAFAGASSSAAPPPPAPATNTLWRQELQEKQDSQPAGAIQKTYSHPAWIPLARDWGGNCLAVDLAPGPAGKWGQVIIFGRDYDCKYVVARSWAHFLALLADDLGSENVHIDEETMELKLLEFKKQNVEPPYLEILRWRADQKYGRKPPRRRPGPPNGGLHINPNLAGTSSPRGSDSGSPYASPVSGVEERGRSSNRPHKGATASPRTKMSSPLARVAEEAPLPIRVNTDVNGIRKPIAEEKLVSVDTPRTSGDIPSPRKLTMNGHDKENADVKQVVENKIEPSDDSELKTIEI